MTEIKHRGRPQIHQYTTEEEKEQFYKEYHKNYHIEYKKKLQEENPPKPRGRPVKYATDEERQQKMKERRAELYKLNHHTKKYFKTTNQEYREIIKNKKNLN